jgi:hypothetical protein
MACNIIKDTSELKLPSQYDSKKFYLIKWKSDNEITVVDGWNLATLVLEMNLWMATILRVHGIFNRREIKS